MRVDVNLVLWFPAPDHHVPSNMAEETDSSWKLSNYDDDAVLQGYQVLKLVAKGSFGKVYKVQKIGTAQSLAMKVVPKDSSINEERILSKLDHNFVIRLRHSFQTEMNVFLVFDFIHGGDLHFHIKKQGFFEEETARIYAAELVAAVAYLHENGIMHRDIKPSNILLDSEGHIVLTDFGMAMEFDINKVDNPSVLSSKYCGTENFMAPEVVLNLGYGRSADWWSVGVTLYEMLTGELPFREETSLDLMFKILHGELRLPEYLTEEARSLLTGLLTKGPRLRLGEGGSEEIKNHKWFGCIDWKKLEARGIRAPRITGAECTSDSEEDNISLD